MTQTPKSTTHEEGKSSSTTVTTREDEKKPQTAVHSADTHEATEHETEPKGKKSTKETESTYPSSDEHEHVYSLMGTVYEDSEIGRAWARMFDKGIDVGPAISTPLTVLQEEFQYFSQAKATRNLARENVNKTVVFTDARGPLGEESGL